MAQAPGTGRKGEQNFHGQKHSNETHASTIAPDARLYRKGRGKEAKLAFMGHALMENSHGLIVGAVATCASGHAERLAARRLMEPHADQPQKVTLAGDKGFAKTVAGLRKARHCGLPKVDWQFTFAMAACNLVCLPKLLVVAA